MGVVQGELSARGARVAKQLPLFRGARAAGSGRSDEIFQRTERRSRSDLSPLRAQMLKYFVVQMYLVLKARRRTIFIGRLIMIVKSMATIEYLTKPSCL